VKIQPTFRLQWVQRDEPAGNRSEKSGEEGERRWAKTVKALNKPRHWEEQNRRETFQSPEARGSVGLETGLKPQSLRELLAASLRPLGRESRAELEKVGISGHVG